MGTFITKKAMEQVLIDAEKIRRCEEQHEQHEPNGRNEIIEGWYFQKCKWCPIKLPMGSYGVHDEVHIADIDSPQENKEGGK